MVAKTTSMESSLSGATTAYQCFGLQFFSLNAESFQDSFHQRSKVSKRHKIILCIILAVLSVLAFAVIFAIKMEKQKQQNDNVTTSLLVQFASYIFQAFVVSASVLHSYLSTGKAKKIFINFERVFRIFMNELNENVDFSGFTRKHRFDLLTVTVLWAFASVTVLACVYQTNQSNRLLWAAIVVGPDLFEVFVFFYFIFYIELVKEMLIHMKSVLTKLSMAREFSKMSLQVISYDTRYPTDSNKTFNGLLKLKRMYSILHETVKQINNLMGLPVLGVTVLLVVCNISSGYKVFLALMGDLPFARLAVPLYTILLTVLILSRTVYSCDSCYEAFEDYFSQLSRFEFNQAERENGTQSICAEMAMQINHQPIAFTVAGFYVITKSFLASIITGVLTYVIILAQFYKPTD